MLNNTISPSENSHCPPSPSPINIWLVDDNRALRRTLMEILGKCDGLRCTASFHSPNAVLSALASKTGPDVILLDIQMGEACGLDAIRPIKALSRSTQVLMLTTFFDSESRRRALSDGASGFLLKRFPIEQILASIQQASKNPAPHLKFARRQSRPTSCDPKAGGLHHQPKRRWLKQCLDLIHFRRN